MRPFHPHRADRGFTLIEVLIALLILSIVITTSLAVLYDRHRRVREAGETMLAWQALSNEALARRHQTIGSLVVDEAEPFLSDTSLLEPLGPSASTVLVTKETADVYRLDLRISWKEGTRSASIEVFRTDTGGGALW